MNLFLKDLAMLNANLNVNTEITGMLYLFQLHEYLCTASLSGPQPNNITVIFSNLF